MSWRRPGDERNDKKTCLYRYFLLEVRYVKKVLLKANFFDECKKSFTIKGVSKTSKNTYIIHVIETNGENHEKITDECKQTFTIKGVYKSQTNKYIIPVIETNG